MKYSKNYIDFLSDLEAVLRKHNGIIKAEIVHDERYRSGKNLRLYLKCGDEFSYGSTGCDEYTIDADKLEDVIDVFKTK